MEVPFSSQGSSWSRQEVTDANCTRRGFTSTQERDFLQWEQSFSGITSPKTWWSRCCQRFSRCSWLGCQVMSSRLLLPQKVGPDHLSRSLQTWAVLWLCGYCLVWEQFFQSEFCSLNDGIISVYIHLLLQLPITIPQLCMYFLTNGKWEGSIDHVISSYLLLKLWVW